MNIKNLKLKAGQGDDRQIEIELETITTTTELISLRQLKQQIADFDEQIAEIEVKRQPLLNKLKEINKKFP